MLFNSIEFLFFFLPFTLVAFFMVNRFFGHKFAIATLVLCSLFFYSWWNPSYLALIISSMVLNYLAGRQLSQSSAKAKKSILFIGVALNLVTLGYFKYTNFLLDNINNVFSLGMSWQTIILPLAISFFTFQQIAYLVDSYKGITREYSFLHYCLFVTFFPQLIAGPIVHHKEMLPQFQTKHAGQFRVDNFFVGLSIFAIGLFKKTVLADNLAVHANDIFAMADDGMRVDFVLAWVGALCYTLQLYFDFSGYSDMAIGLARMFNITLPLNFYSPYKSVSIVEFWRRWHITLSRFLRDYLYIPLGGNRKGSGRRYVNLLTTMILGGIWHGAGWNFVIWGFLHGMYLTINHFWQSLVNKVPILRLPTAVAWFITMIAVIIGWVFFRALSLDGAMMMLSGMFGQNGIDIPNAILARAGDIGTMAQQFGVNPVSGGARKLAQATLWIIAGIFIVLALPNVMQMYAKIQPALTADKALLQQAQVVVKLQWQANKRWAIVSATLLVIGLMTLGQISDFLYFQF